MKTKTAQWRIGKKFEEYLQKLITVEKETVVEIKLDSVKKPKFVQIIMEDKNGKN